MPLKPDETAVHREKRLRAWKVWTKFTEMRRQFKRDGHSHEVADLCAEAVWNDRIRRREIHDRQKLSELGEGGSDPWDRLRNEVPTMTAHEKDVAAIVFELMGTDPLIILESPDMLDSIPSRGTVNLLQWVSESSENKTQFITTWARAALKDDAQKGDRLTDDGTIESLDILREIKRQIDEAKGDKQDEDDA